MGGKEWETRDGEMGGRGELSSSRQERLVNDRKKKSIKTLTLAGMVVIDVCISKKSSLTPQLFLGSMKP